MSDHDTVPTEQAEPASPPQATGNRAYLKATIKHGPGAWLRDTASGIVSSCAVVLLVLLAGETRPEYRALIYHAAWRIDPTDEDGRRTAAHLFEQVYSVTPNAEWRKHYHELTGLDLPAPPPLPPPPADISPVVADYESLLAAADALIASL